MLNKEKLQNCNIKVIKLADWIDALTKTEKWGEMIVTSAYRSPEENANIPTASKTSLHTKGLAIDFAFKDTHIFKVVSILFKYFLDNKGVWESCTQFEVCRDVNGTQHIHCGFGEETVKISWTGIYK